MGTEQSKGVRLDRSALNGADCGTRSSSPAVPGKPGKVGLRRPRRRHLAAKPLLMEKPARRHSIPAALSVLLEASYKTSFFQENPHHADTRAIGGRFGGWDNEP